MKIEKSKELFRKAKEYIPGGVNSPVRAFKSVGGDPIFIESGAGAHIRDVDGNEYIDYVGSWGPHLFGHNPPFIMEAIADALNRGTSFGAPCEPEVEMARLICELVPSVDLVRMVNSGTEATMSAIRLARGFTGRDKIIKFEGCYHGHGDSFLIKAGSGALTLGVPTSPGVPASVAAETLVADYNDIESVRRTVNEHRGEIAAIIIEPVAGNMGVVKSDPEFLRQLRELCDLEEIVLIFDEVMTGFRLAPGGAQEIYGIMPDLTTFGKVIGGGMPVGAFGGRQEIMRSISPEGPVYQAGTLSGNPIAMAAGAAVLKHIKNNPDIYSDLNEKAIYLENGLKENLSKLGRSYAMNRAGSMLCMFFRESPVDSYDAAARSDTRAYGKYFHEMLDRGIYLAAAQFEAMFVSTAHTEEDIDRTISAHYDSLKSI
ncbi:MAG: glutamate-1-semialdehyde 2,1-aminomutase [Candidatus Kapaibacterium sp.]